eukprot:TRINITY_DN1590_c0_g1_i2.p1 TRINITY_DN1590_c0_g1~~TRINITY_DN1590_c0_g1_i2.p1  ORF type:complete len:298 (+),score=66.46 TRINITY_DN1590_c0_g1_i2:491-1384(+)
MDIGGNGLLRTAAKNPRVTVLCDPSDYAAAVEHLRRPGPDAAAHRFSLACKAVTATAAYDQEVVAAAAASQPNRVSALPPSVYVAYLPQEIAAAALEKAEAMDKHRWAEEGRPGRSTLNFGWDFVSLERGELRWLPFPAQIAALRDAMYALFGGVFEADMPRDGPEALDNMIITFYGPGDSIVPHVDRDDRGVKPYHFSDSILGAVLKPDEDGKIFWQRHDQPDKASLTMDQIAPDYTLSEVTGAAFLFQGEARHWPWYHGVIPSKNARVSVTLRHTHIVQPRAMKVVGELKPGWSP